MPKSSTERVRAFRARKRAEKPPKQPPKSSAQRVRECRARRKALKNAAAARVLLPISVIPTIGVLQSTSEPSKSNDTSASVIHNFPTTNPPYTNFQGNQSDHRLKKNKSGIVELCAVPNCPSRHDRDITCHKNAGLREVSLFGVPKRYNMLQNWSRVLGLELSKKDVVCELHFSKESIKTEFRTIMPNGKVSKIPCQKYTLLEGTIPVVTADKGDANPVNVVIPETVVKTESCNVADSIVTNTDLPESVALVNADARESFNVDGSILDNSDPGDINGYADDLLETSSDNKANVVSALITNGYGISHQHCHGSSNDDERVCGLTNDFYSCATSLENSLHSVVTATSTLSDEQATNDKDPLQFLINDAFVYLRKEGFLPETWSWVTNSAKENAITFVQIDPLTLKIRLYLDLHNDLSVTFRTSDDIISGNLSRQVTSIQNLQKLLKATGNMAVCCGSGFEENCRTKDCPGLIRQQKYTKFVKFPRCEPCRKLRLKIQNRLNRRTISAEARYARLKRDANLKHHLCEHLKRMVSSLKHEVVTARQGRADVEQYALNTAISELPPAQQETIRDCFKEICNSTKLL